MLIKFSRSFNLTLSIVLTLWIFSSCSTSKKVVSHEIKPMTSSKIIRKVANETPKYKNYESKKISINYKDNHNKNNFSGQFKIDHDECIIVTLKKLNLPLGRAYLSPDSLFFVNYLEKYYIKDGLRAIEDIIGVELDYQMLQAFLTADVSSLLKNEDFDKTLESYIDENMYRIDSKFNSRIDRALATGNDKRLSRYMQKMDNSEFIDYNVWIDPEFFVIRKLTFNNIKSKEKLTINYDEYELVGRSLFPQQVSMKLNTPKQNMELEVKLTKPIVNKTSDFNFSIPEKFEELKVSKNQ